MAGKSEDGNTQLSLPQLKTHKEGEVESTGLHTALHTAEVITHLIVICQRDKSTQAKER